MSVLMQQATPKETRAYLRGVKAGITMYAWWKEGTQFVGTCGTTLKEAIKRIELYENTPEVKDG